MTNAFHKAKEKDGCQEKKCPPHEWTSHWINTEEILGAEDGVHFVRKPAKLCIKCGTVEQE